MQNFRGHIYFKSAYDRYINEPMTHSRKQIAEHNKRVRKFKKQRRAEARKKTETTNSNLRANTS